MRRVAALAMLALTLSGCAAGGATPVSSLPPATAPATPTRYLAAPAATPTAGTVTVGDGFARLRLAPPTEVASDAIGLDVRVQEVASAIVDDRWTWPLPLDAAAHHLGSANPGEPGNIIISGHVITRSGTGVFERVPLLHLGDTLTLTSADGVFVYQVQSIDVTDEQDLTPFRQTTTEELTLITCLPDGVYQHRVIVRASRVDSAGRPP